MPTRKKPAATATSRSPRKNPVKRTKPPPRRKEKPAPRARAEDLSPVVFKEENSDGLTAKELQRRLAVRAAVSPAFIDALQRDFKRHGAGAIAKTRELAPATYVRLAAVLLPIDAEPADPAPEPASPDAAAEEDAASVARRIAELRDFIARERAGPAQEETSPHPNPPPQAGEAEERAGKGEEGAGEDGTEREP